MTKLELVVSQLLIFSYPLPKSQLLLGYCNGAYFVHKYGTWIATKGQSGLDTSLVRHSRYICSLCLDFLVAECETLDTFSVDKPAFQGAKQCIIEK